MTNPEKTEYRFRLYATDDSSEGGTEEGFWCDSDEEAVEEAKLWCESTPNDSDTTQWWDVVIDRALPVEVDEHGRLCDNDKGWDENIERITVAVEPNIPDCNREPSDDEEEEMGDFGNGEVTEVDGHRFVQIYLHGHGGGIIVNHKCSRCGLRWKYDSWPNCGGQQGFSTNTYSDSFEED